MKKVVALILFFVCSCPSPLQASAQSLEEHEQAMTKYRALITTTTKKIEALCSRQLSSTSHKKKNNEGLTPLHFAVIGNLPTAVEALVSKGVNVNEYSGDYKESDPVQQSFFVLRDYPHGLTALHFAARAGASAFIKILLDAGAAVNAQTKTDGLTALHFATYKKSPECVELLLEHGADPFILSLAELSPLLCAAQRGDTKTFMTLAKKADSDPEFRDRLLASRTKEDYSSSELQLEKEGLSLLELATQGKHTEIVDYLMHLKALSTTSL